VVGVVGDVVRGAKREVEPEFYLPYQQYAMGGLTLVARTSVGAAELAAAVREQLRTLDPTLAIVNVKTMDEHLSDAVAPRRFTLLLLGALALLALVLASGGVYGTLAYLVAQRTHEIGLRQALGATTGEVVRSFVRQGVRLGVYGLAFGLAAALALARVIQDLLFGVYATDPLTYAGVAALSLSVVLLASWLPSRHAAAVSPLEALRHE
jgi:ABC-type antimicrobial peptide transport system permease subunit